MIDEETNREQDSVSNGTDVRVARITLPILFQDDALIAIAKPAGMLVHRSDIDHHETRFVVQLLRNQIRQRVYPIHRLDKPTSGVLLFALNPDAAGRVAEEFNQRKVIKNYLAVVRGYTDAEGVIDYALQRDSGFKHRSTAAPLEATTLYQRLSTVELPIPVGRYQTCRYSLLNIKPETGRRHQIRRHMKHIFHPIVGDTTHGDGRHNIMFREHFQSQRLLLTAHRLTFTHPYTHKSMTITCPPDDSFMRILIALSMDDAI